MPLNAQDLAKKLHDALSQKADGNGVPTQISQHTRSYATGIINALKAGTFSHAPGTINGVTAPGAPLAAGSAIGGIMVLTPAPMIAQTANGFGVPPPPQLAAENTAVVAYVMTGLINFAPGNITGTCTNTPVSPGPLVGGAGMNGTVVGLTGVACLGAVAAALGSVGPDALAHYTELIDYITTNLQATYAPGSVVGVCPPAGGPLAGGTGVGGMIS